MNLCRTDLCRTDLQKKFVPNTPSRLRAARACYDHIAGTAGVLLHNRFRALGWLTDTANDKSSDTTNNYDITPAGVKALTALGIDVAAAKSLRRRFAYGCLDWSERQPHLGGALGAALLKTSLTKKWMTRDLDSRVLSVTSFGRREMIARFGLHL